MLFGQELLAPQSLDGVPDHGGYLTPGERRLIVEWIDLGAAYRNVPARETSAALLARDRFAVEVHPLLRNRCLGCHLPQANSSDIGAPNHRNPPHAPNRFALTGTVEADFGAAAAMVGDPCDPAANALLLRPSSTEQDPLAHPSVDRGGVRGPMLLPGDEGYSILHDWIATGCR